MFMSENAKKRRFDIFHTENSWKTCRKTCLLLQFQSVHSTGILQETPALQQLWQDTHQLQLLKDQQNLFPGSFQPTQPDCCLTGRLSYWSDPKSIKNLRIEKLLILFQCQWDPVILTAFLQHGFFQVVYQIFPQEGQVPDVGVGVGSHEMSPASCLQQLILIVLGSSQKKASAHESQFNVEYPLEDHPSQSSRHFFSSYPRFW